MPSASRDPWLDNAKMALVLLVVVGHMWALLPADGTGGWLYDFLYLWHMPAFVFLSGYLSRAFTLAPDRMWQVATSLVVPYLFFEAALGAFRLWVGGEQLDDLFADPHFPLWYLVALAVWRFLTPLFRPLWGGVAVAIAISLAGGFVDGDPSRWLDLARILGFLPFFVLGLKATPERLAWLQGRFPAVLGVGVLGVLALVATDLERWASRATLYYRPYDLTDDTALTAVLTRLAVIAAGVAGGFAFLTLVPRVGGWFTRMGAATMIVYLFHGFAVKSLEYAGFPEWADGRPVLGLVAATAVGVAVALLLAIPPVRRLLAPVVDPFGAAQRRVREAVALTGVVHEQERHGPDVPAAARTSEPVTSSR